MRVARITLGAMAMIGLAASAPASATILTANSSGWITDTEITNSSGFGGGGGINNSFAGFEEQAYNDWFEFTVPGATVTSATLNIWNDARNTTIDPDALYTVHAPMGYTFAGLAAGDPLGLVTLGTADDGTDHFVSIVLNGAGLAYLNANLGGELMFGGSIATSVDPARCDDCVSVFGFTAGTPAATLALNETSVPEPASWALMIGGFGLVGSVMRTRRSAVAAA